MASSSSSSAWRDILASTSSYYHCFVLFALFLPVVANKRTYNITYSFNNI